MSPNPTDDLLVHDLTERADRVLPTMALDPSGVLLASRRHRGRQTAVRSAAGVLAVGAFVVGATQIWADEPATTPPAGVQQEPRPMGDGQTVELAPGVIAVNRPVETTLDDGTTILELGLTMPGTGDGQGVDAVAASLDADTIRQYAGDTPVPADRGVAFTSLEGGRVLNAGPATSVTWSTADENFYPTTGETPYPSTPSVQWQGTDVIMFFGAVSSWLPDPRVVAFSEQGFTLGDGTITHHLEVPTFRSMTDDGRLLYTVKVSGEQKVAPPGRLIDTVLFVGSDGTVVPTLSCAGLSLASCADQFGPELLAAVDAGDTLSIQVAQDVAAAGSSAGPVVDLGVPVRNDFARMMADGEREELTYAILLTTVGEMAAGAEVSLTPEEAAGDAVLLAGLKPFGALVPMSSSDLGTTRAAKDASPILQAGLSTHDVNALGMLPAGSRATVVLVVERAAGTERVPVPTFRVPGVDEDFFFLALTDPEVEYAAWPFAFIEVTAQDGTTSRWSLDGVEQP